MRFESFWRALVLAGVAALLGACGDRAPTEPFATLAGSYQLQQVDGQPLPFVFTDTELQRGEVVEGSLRLERDGAYHLSITVNWILGTTGGELQVFQRSGLYEPEGDRIVFRSGADLVSTGRMDGDRVTKTAEVEGAVALTYTFERTAAP
jgi:hypothetical protein